MSIYTERTHNGALGLFYLVMFQSVRLSKLWTTVLWTTAQPPLPYNTHARTK